MNKRLILKSLPAYEIEEIHSMAEVLQRQYVVSGYVNLDQRIMILFRGDGTSMKLSFNVFTPSPVETPDFEQFDIIDYGQTIKLGNYEVPTDWVIDTYEKFLQDLMTTNIN